MNLGLANRVAVVVAASRGLGFSSAKHLVSEGVNVVICARDKDRLSEAKKELLQLGSGKIEAVVADVHRPEDRLRVFKRARSKFGPIDILVVNTPGGVSGLKAVHETSTQNWNRALKAKFFTALSLSQAVLPEMQKSGWGRIVNIGTITALEPPSCYSLSNATRLAVLGLFRTMAVENGHRGVCVNSVLVGYTKTDALDGYIQSLAESHTSSSRMIEKRLKAETPINRFLNPDETGALVAFLCSTLTSGITGQTFRVDGGFSKSL